MKTAIGSMVLLSIIMTGPALASDDWTLTLLPPYPTARDAHALASLGGDQVLLFGGYDGAYDGETWVYDLSENTWTRMFPLASLSARYRHATHSLGVDQVLMY